MRGALAACLLVGCYSPQPNAGAPCPDGVCPTGLVCSPATMTCETTATSIDAAVMHDAAPDTFVPIDADTRVYLYRRQITIANASTSPLPTGFSIRVPLASLATLVSQNKVNADFSDLRVIGATMGERDRIIDPPSGPAPPALTFSLASSIAAGATSTEYSLYYGRPTAPAAPANGTNVFPLYDDFTTLSSIWLTNSGPSVSAGKLVLRPNNTDAIATTAATDNVPLVSSLELIVSISDPNSEPVAHTNGTFYYWFGFQHTGDFTESDPWAVWIARGKGALHGEQKSPNGCLPTQCDGPSVTQDTNAHYYAIERDAGSTRYYRDGALSFQPTVTNTDLSVMVRNFALTSTMTVDYVRARARVSPDPTITVGNEQNL